MNIEEYVAGFTNHPILFVGTGISLRYLENSFTWDGLLESITVELKGNSEFYLDIKSNCERDGKYDYPEIATQLEIEFNKILMQDRQGNFKDINDQFYENMQKGINISRFKIYISKKLKGIHFKENKNEEIKLFRQIRKNVGSVITTNYDKLIEELFDFSPLIGNDILLSNPYGAIYKIHGCVSSPKKIIITAEDYEEFNNKYELIRAQLLSLFIHHPIIFLGYNIGDDNIKSILRTIFTYVEPNSSESDKIRKNFLLIEYAKDSDNLEVVEHDIDMDGFATIRINKLKTDNYISLYNSLSALQLPVSAMDIRKVQSIVKEIYSGGTINVNITEDLDNLRNSDKVLVIGSAKTIKYEFQTTAQLMANYFNVIDESNYQLLALIDKLYIQENQFFPIYGFSKINESITVTEKLKKQQEIKLGAVLDNLQHGCKSEHTTIDDIIHDESISLSNKENAILYGIMKENLNLEHVMEFLKCYDNKKCTGYRKMLCAYDFMKYKTGFF